MTRPTSCFAPMHRSIRVRLSTSVAAAFVSPVLCGAIDRRYFRGRYYGDWATSQHHYTMRYPGTLTLSQITETEWIEPVARAGSTETGGGAIVVACVAIGDSALNIDPVDL